jgi:hypothetical protein
VVVWSFDMQRDINRPRPHDPPGSSTTGSDEVPRKLPVLRGTSPGLRSSGRRRGTVARPSLCGARYTTPRKPAKTGPPLRTLYVARTASVGIAPNQVAQRRCRPSRKPGFR